MAYGNVEVVRLRRQVLENDDCVLLTRHDYCNLAISNRILERRDEPAARLHGVFEPATGTRFLIEDEKLYSGA
jgi:hypothetical protein